MSKIIFFELNEVPYKIIDDYVENHPGSTIAKIINKSNQKTTITKDSGHLSPWTTWSTLHRGVHDEKHLIANFGQDLTEVNNDYPALHDLLKKNNVSVGLCGTLHSFPMPKNYSEYAFYLPDSFAPKADAFPDVLTSFQDFNISMVKSSGRNVDSGIDTKKALKVFTKSFSLGIKFSTYFSLLRQLITERKKPWLKTRRRTFQSMLAFDVFEKFLNDTKPQFATFFTNHVASAMHRYWAAAYPNDYEEFKLEDEWVEKYNNEIDWAMNKADHMLKRLDDFVSKNSDYEIWIVSSMGQAAVLAQPLETQLYIEDLNKFLINCGLEDNDFEIRPAMRPQYNIAVNADVADAFEKTLQSISVNSISLPYRRVDNFFSMDWGQPNVHELQTNKIFAVNDVFHELDNYGLAIVEIDEKADTTAYHIPQGIFIQHPKAKSETRDEISVLEVAPMVLANFDVEIPEYMESVGIKA